MDLGTLVGIIGGLGLIFMAILMGSDMASFINIPSVFITVGGTIAATLINFPLPHVVKTMGVVKNTLVFRLPSHDSVIKQILYFTEKVAKEGTLGLESELENINYPFFKRGIMFVVDGVNVNIISNVLKKDIDNMKERHKKGQGILTAMGTYAPAFGMIGTLIGLIAMLRNLNDPSQIGGGMAVALLTTFYGAVMANLIFLPLAGKLTERSKEELQLRELVKEGVLAIGTGESKRFVEERIITFLSQSSRDKFKK